MDPTTLFGLGISGFTFAIICIIMLFSLVVVAASVAIPIYFMHKNQQRAEQLMASGTQGEATILSLEDTGMLINNNPRVTILLEIRMPYGAPYQVKKTMTVPLIRLSQVQTGSIVQVMVDMSDPTNPDKVGLLFKVMGYLLLEGGAEFGGRMRDPDLRALELAGGFDAPLRIIPAAAAPDNNHRHAGSTGVNWFQGLGARDAVSLPLIDKSSANDKEIVKSLRSAKLIYLLGGFTHFLGQTLKDSLAWKAAVEAYQNGAVIAGSSAGAMVMCQFYYDPSAGKVIEGLNLIPNSLVLPHHNTFGKSWASSLLKQIPDVTLIGIDEQTGMIDDGENHSWNVYGRGEVTLYRDGQIETYKAGKAFSIMSF